ncbi:FG-GAP repeat [Carpediemonas membranifera]|uniref:FG-GAP repeat n=1 Tax=Carpediemonas membranifera TaxID=201153 RepID=A0A8J6E0L2_9EUKA|nr:FG-GAP repeat [Carpediemonas membranifera]|eukprot:KAG9392378.1 FG-GAP repeat [Carpediemonas membranifera]
MSRDENGLNSAASATPRAVSIYLRPGVLPLIRSPAVTLVDFSTLSGTLRPVVHRQHNASPRTRPGRFKAVASNGSAIFGRKLLATDMGTGAWLFLLLTVAAAADIAVTETQRLSSEYPADLNRFGVDLMVCGTLACIGQFNNNDATGRAFVYQTTDGETWSFLHELQRDDFSAPGDIASNFGSSCALDATRIAVGAEGDVITTLADAGSVYIFEATGAPAQWEQAAKVTPDTPEADARFGSAVAVAGDTLVVGSSGYSGSGAVYIFKYGSTWTQSNLFAPLPADTGYRFGCSVDIDGDWIVVGADRISVGGVGAVGQAFVYQNTGAQWVYHAVLTPTVVAEDTFFGSSVSVCGDTIAVGADASPGVELSSTGVVYVYRLKGTTWAFAAKLNGTEPGEKFGRDVSLSGGVLVVGATGRGAVADSGNAYVFIESHGVWILTQTLGSAAPVASAVLGGRVAVDGAAILATAWGEANEQGAVYFFDNQWGYCPPGTYNAAGVCVDCSTLGEYAAWNQTACSPAAVGSFSDDYRTEVACTDDGAYTNVTGSTECVTATAGWFVDPSDHTKQRPCDDEWYSSDPGQAGCTACEPLTSTPADGEPHTACTGYVIPGDVTALNTTVMTTPLDSATVDGVSCVTLVSGPVTFLVPLIAPTNGVIKSGVYAITMTFGALVETATVTIMTDIPVNPDLAIDGMSLTATMASRVCPTLFAIDGMAWSTPPSQFEVVESGSVVCTATAGLSSENITALAPHFTTTVAADEEEGVVCLALAEASFVSIGLVAVTIDDEPLTLALSGGMACGVTIGPFETVISSSVLEAFYGSTLIATSKPTPASDSSMLTTVAVVGGVALAGVVVAILVIIVLIGDVAACLVCVPVVLYLVRYRQRKAELPKTTAPITTPAPSSIPKLDLGQAPAPPPKETPPAKLPPLSLPGPKVCIPATLSDTISTLHTPEAMASLKVPSRPALPPAGSASSIPSIPKLPGIAP